MNFVEHEELSREVLVSEETLAAVLCGDKHHVVVVVYCHHAPSKDAFFVGEKLKLWVLGDRKGCIVQVTGIEDLDGKQILAFQHLHKTGRLCCQARIDEGSS